MDLFHTSNTVKYIFGNITTYVVGRCNVGGGYISMYFIAHLKYLFCCNCQADIYGDACIVPTQAHTPHLKFHLPTAVTHNISHEIGYKIKY